MINGNHKTNKQKKIVTFLKEVGVLLKEASPISDNISMEKQSVLLKWRTTTLTLFPTLEAPLLLTQWVVWTKGGFSKVA